MSSKITPIENKVFIRALNNESTTASGIIIADSEASQTLKGEVVACYKNTNKGGVQYVSVGDIVLYSIRSCLVYDNGGDELLIIREPDLLAIITPKK
jgi:chaperonin GroES